MNWSTKLQLPLEVPLILMWEVSRVRNEHIFQNIPMAHSRILTKICSYSVLSDALVKKVVHRNICYPLVINDALVGCFRMEQQRMLCVGQAWLLGLL